MLSKMKMIVLVVAAISYLAISGCNDDKGANNQDDSYPIEEWTVVQAPDYWLGGLFNVVWSGSQFVAAGGRNMMPNDSGVVAVSPDGLSWTEIHIEGSAVLTALGYNGSQYLTSSWWEGIVYTSTDGLTWTQIDSDLGRNVQFITWIDTVWIASKSSSEGGILTSTDGVTWIERFDDVQLGMTDFASNDSLIVGVGWAGQIVTSPNAVDWTLQSSPNSQLLYGVVWDGSRFLAVGHGYDEGGVIVESNNGIDWRTIDSGSVGNIFGVAVSDRNYAIIGGRTDSVATVAASYDGRDWTPQVCEGGTRLRDIVWNGTRFVAVGDEGLIVASP